MIIMRREMTPCRKELPQPKPYAMEKGKNTGEKNCRKEVTQMQCGKGGEYLKFKNWKKSCEVA